MKTLGPAAALLLFVAHVYAPPASAQQPRGYTIDDMLRLEEVESDGFSFSSDGDRFAFVICGSRAERPQRLSETGSDRCDVWVQVAPNAPAVQLTRGAEDGSSWYAPQWSPDGSTLAMLSTRGGGSIWVWSITGQSLRRLSDQPPARVNSLQTFSWVTDRRIVYRTKGLSPSPGPVHDLIETTSRGWLASLEGRESTASPIFSGGSERAVSPPPNQLLVLDLDGSSQIVSAGGVDQDWRGALNLVAFAQIEPFSPQDGDSRSVNEIGASRLALANIAGAVPLAIELRGPPHVAVEAVTAQRYANTIQISPSGDEVAFLGYPTRAETAPHLYRVDARSGRTTTVPFNGFTADDVLWASGGQLLLTGRTATRTSWWRVDRRGRVHALASALVGSIQRPMPLPSRDAFAGYSDGDLWRITVSSGRADNLTQDLPPARLVWPESKEGDALPRGMRTYGAAVLASSEAGSTQYWIIDLETGARTPLKAPENGAELVAFAPQNGAAIFLVAGDSGTRLWRVNAGAQPLLLAECNQFLREIAPNQWRMFNYQSERGQSLNGMLLLPYNFQEGQRYPVVTMIYPGDVFLLNGTPQSPVFVKPISEFSFLNPHMVAARGYVVLMPSIPLALDDEPYFNLTNGVMPAIDRLVEMGIADSERIFLFGHSFGGYGTQALITQTNRFRAAVSTAGFSNILSTGAFSGELRYTNSPQTDTGMYTTLRGQTRMIGLMWEQPQRYLRNSPLVYADRVETPIMMIHGDLDRLSITQDEEFFHALYAQGKRATFVRYWGEGHLLKSPANVRDMWMRVFRWFDENGGIPVEGDAGVPAAR